VLKTDKAISLFLIAFALSSAACAVTLTGVLVDEGGQPVAGAAVRLLAAGTAVTGDPAPSRADAPQATTGRDGVFHLAAAPAEIAFLQVRHPDFASIEQMAIEVPSGRTTDLGRLTLERGAAFLGKVVDQTGAPLAGIEVWRFVAEQVATATGEKERVAVSRPGGAFVVPGYRTGQKARLLLTGPGGAAQSIEEPVGSATAATLTLRVPRSAATGRVLSPEGKPVPGADVYAIHILDPSSGSGYIPTVTRADAAGRFSYDAIEDGLYTFTASSPDFASGVLKQVTVPAGGRLDGLEVVLKPGATITGRVVTPDGKPAARAAVHDLDSVQSTEADGDGRFRLGWIPLNYPFVSLQAVWQGSSGGASQVPSGTKDLVLVLRQKAGEPVRGRILDPEGRPVAGAHLAGSAAGSGANGSFVLDVPPGTNTIWVRKLGYASLWVPVPNDGRPLDLRLDTGATVTGRITGLTAAEETQVQITARHLDGPSVLVLNDGWGTTDGRGSFRIAHLAPGVWEVAASLDGRVGKFRLSLPGQTAATLDFAVSASPPVQEQ
jgi:hypothetical protein